MDEEKEGMDYLSTLPQRVVTVYIPMIVFLVILVKYNNFYLEQTGIQFLNAWLEHIKYFSLIFVCLCFSPLVLPLHPLHLFASLLPA